MPCRSNFTLLKQLAFPFFFFLVLWDPWSSENTHSILLGTSRWTLLVPSHPPLVTHSLANSPMFPSQWESKLVAHVCIQHTEDLQSYLPSHIPLALWIRTTVDFMFKYLKFIPTLNLSFVWDKVSTCSSDWPGTHCIVYADIRALPAFASQALGLRACAIMPGLP